LEAETKEALASQDWLNISSESILEFLNMDCLDINEADLVRALIRWGKFQTRQSGDDAVENLRSKILPGLQKIRFGSFTQLEVAQLCEGELKEVLTADEKYSILTSLITGDWKMMPTGVVSSSKLVPRNHESYTFCPLPYYNVPHCNVHQPQNSKGSKISTQQMSLKFEVNRKAIIVGVKLDMNAHLHNTLTTISLYKSCHNDFGEKVYVGVGKGVPKSTTLYRGEMFCEINSKEKLAAGREYKMIFTFATSLGGDLGEFKTYSLPKDKNPSCSDGLALKINHESLKSFVHIQGFLFEKEVHPSS
jgi:BTB And C-terminal Kelch